ncbi:MAG: iron uptake transporter deferrochelatase/peroxidase subunit [Frankiaceae bacterium]
MDALSRRRFLSGASTLAAAGAVGAVALGRSGAAHETARTGTSVPSPRDAAPAAVTAPTGGTVPFHGPHQAGITTPQQQHLLLASFDVAAGRRDGLVRLLRDWTRAAEALCAGTYGGSAARDEPPVDSGETAGTGAARLTLTVGFGATLFVRDGQDRFGLAARRPRGLVDLPSFRTDRLVPERCGGDLCVQACADDPLVAMHAVRTLRRVAGDAVALRWTQTGLLGGAPGAPSRNLFGFTEGTGNPAVADESAMADVVWVGRGDAPWLRGGSYLVARRIHLRVEKWDESSLAEQEATFGRSKRSGAPLGGTSITDAPDLSARGPDGAPVIPMTAHIRLASPKRNGGARLLRRGYTYVDGDDRAADFESGLIFLAFQRDPVRQFIAIHTRLSRSDALNEYVVHTGSGLFACPPGVQPGGWWGQQLIEA